MTEEQVQEAVEALLESDAMTGDSDGTPAAYWVDADNVEYLVRTVLAAAMPRATETIEWGVTKHAQVRCATRQDAENTTRKYGWGPVRFRTRIRYTDKFGEWQEVNDDE